MWQNIKHTSSSLTSQPKSLHVAYSYSYIPAQATGYFSRLVTDYLTHQEGIKPFFRFNWDSKGLDEAITERAKYPVNRQILTDALRRQYAVLSLNPRVEKNLELLRQGNTFTICTAHQPNLLTGYLYFVYKILHAVKLSDELNAAHPDKNFVPVYYMGSEDNDIEELGVFKFRGQKYVWDGDGQSGAVGRMNTAGLKKMLNDLFKLFGPPGKDAEHLQELFTQAYLKHKTIGAATQYLVNEFFGRFGVIVLDPDDAALKSTYIPVMEDELLNQSSSPILAKQIALLGANYKIQAHPREINLFYLADQLRERIEKKDDNTWIVLNTDISWTKEEMLAELHAHPERFSPNVMLRGLYQETILPDVAFIGGGAEVAYWMQLKTLFEHYNGFFPCIYLRQSVMIMNAPQDKLQHDLEFSIEEIFRDEEELIKEYVARHSTSDYRTDNEATAMEEIISSLKAKAINVDKTLGPSAEAALTRIKYQLEVLEKKMIRAEKRKMDVQLNKLSRLKDSLFPNGGLQERVDNFSEYYMDHGESFFDGIVDGIKPFGGAFLVIHHS